MRVSGRKRYYGLSPRARFDWFAEDMHIGVLLVTYPTLRYDACGVRHRCSAGSTSASGTRGVTGQCRLPARNLW